MAADSNMHSSQGKKGKGKGMGKGEQDHDFSAKIPRNAGVSILANVIYLASRLFLPPFILKYLSLNEYGIWTYCFIIVGYIGMAVYGITNVYVRYIAVYSAHREYDKINQLASTGVLFAAGLCLLALPILGFSLPYLIQALNVEIALQETAFWVILGTSFIFLFDMTFSIFNATLQSLHRFTIERGFWTLSILAEMAIIVATLLAGWGLYGLMTAFGVRVFLFVVSCGIACKKLSPEFSIHPRFANRKNIPLFYKYGGVVQTTGIISVANRSIERLLAGLTMGPSASALYDIGEKFPMMATTIPSSINSVILPTTSHLYAKELHSKLVDIYLRSSRWINILTGLMMGFMAPFAAYLIAIWLGSSPQYQIAAVILACFTIAFQMDVLTGPGSAIYRGINQPLKELFYPLLQLGLILAASAGLFFFFAPSIWTINLGVVSMTVISALIYIYRNNVFLNVSHVIYIKEVLLPGLYPYFFGGIVYLLTFSFLDPLFTQRFPLFFYFLATLIVYLVIATPVYYFLILDEEEKSYLKQKVNSFLFKR